MRRIIFSKKAPLQSFHLTACPFFKIHLVITDEMCTSNKTSDFGLHSCLIKSKQAINKREFYRGVSVGHV